MAGRSSIPSLHVLRGRPLRGPAASLLRGQRPLLSPKTPPLPLIAPPHPHRAFSLPSLRDLTTSVLPPSPPQTISTRRTLPYARAKVFDLIADVDAYATFLPFCHASRVTAWTPAETPGGGGGDDRKQRRWPARADLTVGWGPWAESYTSELTCDPAQGVVEAVSGRRLEGGEEEAELQTERRDGTVAREGNKAVSAGTAARIAGDDNASAVFESLVTRWTVSPTGTEDRSDVTLVVRFRFVNAAYGVAMGHMGTELVEKMIEAFERRAKELYG